MRRFILFVLILIASLVVFFPTTTTYFSQDDWVFLSHVYKRPWIDVFRYYPEAFYRPIGQQLFFKIGSVLFGLNPVGYHVLVLGIHLVNTIMLWKVLNLLSRHSGANLRAIESPARLLLILLYVLHPVHLIALNWLTQVDIEIAVLFSFLTILTFKKHFFLSVVTFIAALLSHETAAMLPMIMMLKGPTPPWRGRTLRISDGLKGQILRMQGLIFRSKWVVLFCIAAIVLLAKYLANPFSFQSDYSLGFHPIQLFSTTKWYVLRALFIPEGIRALPIAVQLASIVSAGLLVVVFRWRLLGSLAVFTIGLAPVLLFSQHVFSVYAILPVLWMVLELGRGDVILEGAERPIGSTKDSIASVRQTDLRSRMTVVAAIIFIFTSYLISRSVLPSHWTTTRGEISRELSEEFFEISERSDLAARSDLMKFMDFPTGSEPSFASMMGRQFEVLGR